MEVRRDLIDERLEPGGNGVVGMVFGPSSVECRVAGCFAGFLEAVGFVSDSVPGHVLEERLVPVDVFLEIVIVVGLGRIGFVGCKKATVDVKMETFGGIFDDEDFGWMTRAF